MGGVGSGVGWGVRVDMNEELKLLWKFFFGGVGSGRGGGVKNIGGGSGRGVGLGVGVRVDVNEELKLLWKLKKKFLWGSGWM